MYHGSACRVRVWLGSWCLTGAGWTSATNKVTRFVPEYGGHGILNWVATQDRWGIVWIHCARCLDTFPAPWGIVCVHWAVLTSISHQRVGLLAGVELLT